MFSARITISTLPPSQRKQVTIHPSTCLHRPPPQLHTSCRGCSFLAFFWNVVQSRHDVVHCDGSQKLRLLIRLSWKLYIFPKVRIASMWRYLLLEDKFSLRLSSVIKIMRRTDSRRINILRALTHSWFLMDDDVNIHVMQHFILNMVTCFNVVSQELIFCKNKHNDNSLEIWGVQCLSHGLNSVALFSIFIFLSGDLIIHWLAEKNKVRNEDFSLWQWGQWEGGDSGLCCGVSFTGQMGEIFVSLIPSSSLTDLLSWPPVTGWPAGPTYTFSFSLLIHKYSGLIV